MIALSKHFVSNWTNRIGGVPSPEMVDSIIQGSIWVQRQSKIRCSDGTVHSTLSIYWHPDLDVIIKTDPSTNMAVTVLDKHINKRENRRCQRKPKQK